MKRRHAILAGCLTLLSLGPIRAVEPPPRPLVTVRLVEPDREMDRLLSLFRGARAASPADALAAWKRASVEPKRLGKPLEALLAALNPAMGRELRSLDGATLTLPSLTAPLPWTLVLPRDDGTFAALGSALVLTDGAEEPPLDGVAVNRLGPPGSPLMTRVASGLTIAGTREALRPLSSPDSSVPPGQRALRARIDLGALSGPDQGAWATVTRWVRATGWKTVDLDAGFVGPAWQLRSTVDGIGGGPDHALEPGWLDLIPRDRAGAAVALSLDPTAWDAGFALVDRAERAIPGHENVAPSRLRLGWLAQLTGVRREAEVIPHLRGVVAWAEPAGPDPGSPRGVVAGFFDSEDAAAAVRRRLQTRPGLVAIGRGPILLLGSNEASLNATRDALDHPDRSAGVALRAGWGETPPQRAGWLWPGRWPGWVPTGTPLAEALATAPPVCWTGRDAEDRVEWADLDGLVRRFLDRIPLQPPPDR